MGHYRANSARSRLPVGRSWSWLEFGFRISLARQHQCEGYRRRCEQEIAHHRGPVYPSFNGTAPGIVPIGEGLWRYLLFRTVMDDKEPMRFQGTPHNQTLMRFKGARSENCYEKLPQRPRPLESFAFSAKSGMNAVTPDYICKRPRPRRRPSAAIQSSTAISESSNPAGKLGMGRWG